MIKSKYSNIRNSCFISNFKLNLPAGKAGIKNSRGLSLLEILVFTLLMSIVMIGISYLTVYSVRNARFIEDKTKATRYAQQAAEWLRGQQEADWNTFASSLSEDTYCLATFPDSIATISSKQGACTDYGLAGYKRELIITDINSGQTSVNYKILVRWRDGTNVGNVSISSTLAVGE